MCFFARCHSCQPDISALIFDHNFFLLQIGIKLFSSFRPLLISSKELISVSRSISSACGKCSMLRSRLSDRLWKKCNFKCDFNAKVTHEFPTNFRDNLCSQIKRFFFTYLLYLVQVDVQWVALNIYGAITYFLSIADFVWSWWLFVSVCWGWWFRRGPSRLCSKQVTIRRSVLCFGSFIFQAYIIPYEMYFPIQKQYFHLLYVEFS